MRFILTARALGLTMLAVAAIAGTALLAGRTAEFAIASPAGVDLGLRVDALSTVLLGFVGFVSCLVATFARRNLQGQQRTTAFGTGLLIATVALGIMVTGASLPVVAAGWTASGLAVAYLIGHSGTPSARRASSFVRRRLLVSDALLWTATVAAVTLLPSVNRADLDSTTMPLVPVTAVTLLLAGAGVVRSALAPAHRWLPETAEAPTPVSAFLHAGIINGAGIVGALMWPLFSAAPVTLVVLVGIGIVSVAVGTWTGRLRNDVKGRLACSTTAQMGYMTLQLGLGMPAAAVLHLIGHGCYKSWLFLRAGGAVTRQRLQPAAAGRSNRGIWTYAAAVLTTMLVSVLAWPAVASSIAALGSTAIVPGVLAAATAAIAASGVMSHPRMGRRAGLAASVLTAMSAAGYLWLLLAWEHLLETSLPLAAVFPPGAGYVVVLAVVASGIGIGVGARIIRNRPGAALTRLLTSSTLAPWTAMPARPLPWPLPPGADGHECLTATEAAVLVEDSMRLCAPSWPLRTLVAANPLAGLEVLPFTEADRITRRDLGGSAFLPPASYLTLFDSGRITRSMLVAALSDRIDGRVDEAQLIALVEDLVSRTGHAAASPPTAPGSAGIPLAAMEHANLWCQRAWSRALDDSKDPWAMWLGSTPRTNLPADPAEAIATLLDSTGLRDDNLNRYVSDLLLAAPGWASHAAWRARQQGSTSPLLQLVALRAAFDALMRDTASVQLPSGKDAGPPDSADADDLAVWQAAFEHGFRDPLADDLRSQALLLARRRGVDSPTGSALDRPDAQFVFCIDVRSERIRRGLEQEGSYDTFGYAGFFGLALRHEVRPGVWFDQCPVLVSPAFDVRHEPAWGWRTVVRTASDAATGAPMTPLLVAEAAGVVSGVASLLQTTLPSAWRSLAKRWGTVDDPWAGTPTLGLPLPDRVALAGGALRGLGLIKGFAPFIVICGHAASVENNAFAAAYDCGACGGNGGTINARILAGILNDREVRELLALEGIVIPSDTVAVAATHDTTTDAVHLDPDYRPDPSRYRAFERLASDLQRARVRVARQRIAGLPGAPTRAAGDTAVLAHLDSRGLDWAQPFPEWGLAGNAAFIIGPRELTADLDLDGRAFLHSYEPSTDPDGSTLEQILTAPAIVTQWINAQYYFSTVSPERFGSGDKTMHNVVGDVGVLTGSHGDLRTGLPWQALFTQAPSGDGEPGMHEPLRLLVVAWASPSAVGDIIDRHANLRSLCANEWITVAAIDPESAQMSRLTTTLKWRPWSGTDETPNQPQLVGQVVTR